MKKLGLIGGMGPVSTIDYYQKLVVGFQQDHPQSCPPIVIDSLDVFELLKLEEQNDQAKLFRQLETSIENLTAAGAEYAALTANTPHMIFEELQAASPIPLVSILDPVGEAIKDHQQKRVALLGTKMTMQLPFYFHGLAKQGIEVIAPAPKQIQTIHQIITTELEINIFNPASKQLILQIIAELKAKENIQGIILGCTELPRLLNQTDCQQVTIYDTVALHVKELLAKMKN